MLFWDPNSTTIDNKYAINAKNKEEPNQINDKSLKNECKMLYKLFCV